MRPIIAVFGILPTIKFRRDKAAVITFETQELSAAMRDSLGGYAGEFGCLAFRPGEKEFSEEEYSKIPDYSPEFRDERTPGKRMRSVLFRVWEQNGKQGGYEEYYRIRMDELITQLKRELDA